MACRGKPEIERWRRRIVRWIADNAKDILAARNSVEFPAGLDSRGRDGWEPDLISVALLFQFGELRVWR